MSFPARSCFTVDVRAPDRPRLDRLLAAIGLETGSARACRHGPFRGASGTRSSRSGYKPSSFTPARAMTQASSPPPAFPAGCSSSAA